MTDPSARFAAVRDVPVAGRYRLVRLLGEGGMGTVHEAVDLRTGRGVAVKLLHASVATDAQVVQRFLSEAEVLASIRHPNIVELVEFGREQDGTLYLTQELLVGSDLRSRIEATGRMAAREAFDILMPIMGALVMAHSRGIVHRDLKPENIFLARGPSGEQLPKLIDFGLSKLVAANRANIRLTRTGVPIGTPHYMSPEQARGESDIDARTDVWSLGIVLYELLVGHCPFQDDSLAMLVFKLMSEPIPRIETFAPQVTPDVASLVHKALESDRARRFPSMQDFLVATLLTPSLAASGAEPALALKHRRSMPDLSIPAAAFGSTMPTGARAIPGELEASGGTGRSSRPPKFAATQAMGSMAQAATDEFAKHQEQQQQRLAAFAPTMLAPEPKPAPRAPGATPPRNPAFSSTTPFLLTDARRSSKESAPPSVPQGIAVQPSQSSPLPAPARSSSVAGIIGLSMLIGALAAGVVAWQRGWLFARTSATPAVALVTDGGAGPASGTAVADGGVGASVIAADGSAGPSEFAADAGVAPSEGNERGAPQRTRAPRAARRNAEIVHPD